MGYYVLPAQPVDEHETLSEEAEKAGRESPS
jgi:hypothetical protein